MEAFNIFWLFLIHVSVIDLIIAYIIAQPYDLNIPDTLTVTFTFLIACSEALLCGGTSY